MVNASGSFGRSVFHLIHKSAASRELRYALVTRQIAYVHALRYHLRRQPSGEEIDGFLSPEELEELQGVANVPNAILNEMAAIVAEAASKGWIDYIRRVQLDSLLVDMSNAQGGMERTKDTALTR